ncbi:MAG: hypothetical protein AB1405_14600 [Bdellovibrionota bacterium]
MKKLVFVYNGDSGLWNGVVHYLHKRLSPETYPCQLCGLIYDGTSLNKDWLAFVKTLGLPSEFLHRDEYRKKYGERAMEWPAVLLHEDEKLLSVVIGAGEFSGIQSLETLKERLARFSGQGSAAVSAA